MTRARANADATSQTYIENATATQDLSGTYSTERLYFNDSYQLTGDVTVTGHLALGTIADEDVVITQDGTERTITGSGTLESGNVLQDTHGTDLTGMTGELGSVVTGSPNLNLTSGTLGSGVTFPAGHVVEVGGYTWGANNSTYLTNVNSNSTLWSREINITSGNKVVVCFSFTVEKNSTTLADHCRLYISGSTGSGIASDGSGFLVQQAVGYKVVTGQFLQNISGQVLSDVTSTATPTYSVYFVQAGSGNFNFYQPNLVWFEVQQ